MNWRMLLTFQPREFSSAPSDHRPALDGVRGIAILVVFLYDCLKLPSGGIVNLLGRKLSSAGFSTQRKRRSDARTSVLTDAELALVAA